VPTNRPTTRLLPLLQALFSNEAEGLNDGQLLQHYLTERDDAAFAALVRRHGPMVLAVCRRVLGNLADAEDAFQAAFLVLVRKAPSLTSRSVVGGWLHGVARRTALKAKAAAARRRTVEQTAARPEAMGEEARNDWLAQLDEELSRLPEKYRLPIILCDLEGRTRQQAAKQLGWPEGTVAGRLVRARALLAKRLLRGAQILSGALPGTLAGGAAKAALPLGLVHSTIQAAALVAAGKVTAQGVLSAQALTLAKGVLGTMFWNKMKIVAFALLAAVVFASAGGWTVQMLTPAAQENLTDQPGIPGGHEANFTREAAAQAKENDKPAALAQELVDVGRGQWLGRWKEYLAGTTIVDFLVTASDKLLQAELRLANTKAGQLAAYEACLERMQETERIAKAKFDASRIAVTGLYEVSYARIEAEIQVNELRRAAGLPEYKVKKGSLRVKIDDKKAGIEVDKLTAKTAQEQFEARWKEFMAGKTTVDLLLTASKQWMQAELDAAQKYEDKIAIYRKHLKKAEELSAIAKEKYEAGQLSITQWVSIHDRLWDIESTLHKLEVLLGK